MPENLECTALIGGDQIFTGDTNLAAAKTLLMSPREADQWIELLGKTHEGFSTDEVRFVDADEAARIAKEVGQSILFGSLVLAPRRGP